LWDLDVSLDPNLQSFWEGEVSFSDLRGALPNNHWFPKFGNGTDAPGFKKKP